MSRMRTLAVAGALGCLALSACGSDAFTDIEGDEPILPSEVEQLSIELHTLRPLGVHGDITYVAARSGERAVCLVMYRTEDPSKPIVGCSEGGYVTVGGQDVGEATFFSEGNASPSTYTDGEEVSKWLIIHS